MKNLLNILVSKTTISNNVGVINEEDEDADSLKDDSFKSDLDSISENSVEDTPDREGETMKKIPFMGKQTNGPTKPVRMPQDSSTNLDVLALTRDLSPMPKIKSITKCKSLQEDQANILKGNK